MTGSVVRGALAVGALLLGSAAWAAEPVPEETLPLPRTYTPSAPAYPGGSSYPYVPYQRVSRYEVWQNYGVDRQGRFRPLVVYSPSGPYYRYNGQPFLYSTTHPREFMPHIVDAPPPTPPVPH